jgi:hypothetical protein
VKGDEGLLPEGRRRQAQRRKHYGKKSTENGQTREAVLFRVHLRGHNADKTATVKPWENKLAKRRFSNQQGVLEHCPGGSDSVRFGIMFNSMFARKSSGVVALAVAAACFGLVFHSNAEDLVPLQIKLPSPGFVGTPSDNPAAADVEKPTGKPRPPLMVPPGVTNVALGKTVTSSAANAMPEDLAKITDGDKEANETSVCLLKRGMQWVQIDLGNSYEIYAIVVWHAHDTPKVYHGVVVQVADDADFTKNVRMLFNNDKSNGDGLGVGTNREYFESNEGKLVEGKGTVARYVRLYSRGSTESHMNEYTEVEVYGRPPKT